jgi:hypothetical protein
MLRRFDNRTIFSGAAVMSDPMDLDALVDFLDFQGLPEEVLIQIFSCFDVLDLSRTALVCSDVRHHNF